MQKCCITAQGGDRLSPCSFRKTAQRILYIAFGTLILERCQRMKHNLGKKNKWEDVQIKDTFEEGLK